MIKILSFTQTVLCWFAFVFCVLATLVFFPSVAVPCWILTALLVLPVGPVKRIRCQILPYKFLRILVTVIIFITSTMLTPTSSDEQSVEADVTDTVMVEELQPEVAQSEETRAEAESMWSLLESETVPSKELLCVEETRQQTALPETEAVWIVHEDSSLTSEMIYELEGIAFFWAPSGNKVHLSPNCRSFKKGYTFAGTLEQAQSVRTGGWCGTCSKYANSETNENAYATKEALAYCYSYSDYVSQVPAAAFE